MSRFHRYSFQNILLILSQKPDATRVAGFQTWRSLGRHVRKGEKGIAIFAPMMLRRDRDATTESKSAVAEKAEEPTEGRVLRFRVVHVFDVSQTDGEPLPEPARVSGEVGPLLDRLRAIIADDGITLTEDADLNGADGVSLGSEIRLASGLSEAETFSVLVHELAHERLHKVGERPSKQIRETEAESVAHVVGDWAGLEVGTASSDYIATYKGDRELLTASLDRIQKIACGIIEGLNVEEPDRPASRVDPSSAIAAAQARSR